MYFKNIYAWLKIDDNKKIVASSKAAHINV